jgi:hypothetical protein
MIEPAQSTVTVRENVAIRYLRSSFIKANSTITNQQSTNQQSRFSIQQFFILCLPPLSRLGAKLHHQTDQPEHDEPDQIPPGRW